jgi:cytochrome b6-f complex iron-sulfur subunit
MERRQFFSYLGFGAASLVISKSLISCAKDNTSPNAPQSIDFTLDLNNSSYSALKNKGGSVYHSNIVIIHTNSDQFVALSQICTHQSCTVQYDGSSGLQCPCHGSTFALSGAVTGGPAPTALKSYKTSLSGNNLRVYY